MQFLHDLPIKRKLMVVTMLVSGGALLAACLAFIAYEQAASRKQMVQDLSVTADMTGANSTAGLAFNDPDSVTQALQALSTRPDIVCACVYDKEGQPFARYQRADVKGTFSPPPFQDTGRRFSHDRLELFQPVTLAGEPVGTIFLEADLSRLTARLWRDLLIATLVLLGSAGVALGLSAWLQRVVTEPLADLAKTVTLVAAEKNYSVRVKRHSAGELGQLIDGFNEMLAQIQERDANLERRVQERTREVAESRNFLDRIINSISDPIFVKDRRHRWLLVNDACCQLAGQPRDQIVGRTVHELFPRSEAEVFWAKDEEVFRTGRENINEEKYTGADGKIHTIITKKNLYTGEKGETFIVGVIRDITDRQQAEEALRESQALYQSLVDQLPAGVFRKDREGRYVFVNSWFCRHKGVKPELYLGKTPRELAAIELAAAAADHPDASRLAGEGSQHHDLIMQTGRPIDLEEVSTDARGKTQYYHVVKSPVFGPDGAVVGSQGILLDITQRKQVEAELAYERDLLRTLLDNAPDHIYFKDSQSRFIKSSAAQARQLGASSADELVGKTDFDFFTEAHARPAFEDEQEIIRTGQPIIGKAEKETYKDGRRETWVLTTKMPLRDKAGRIIGTFGISKDITELKEAQEHAAREQARFKFIFDSVPVGISLARNAPDGRLLERLINDAHLHICGLTHAQDEDPTIYRQITHPDDHRRQMELARLVDAGKINHYTVEKRYLRLDGKTVWVLFSFQRRQLPDGSYEELCTVADITATKQAEEERDKLNRQLVEASRQAGMAEVATSVLHNVGNVLNSVNVSTTLVLDLLKKSRLHNLGRLADLIHDQRDQLAAFFTADPRGRQLPNYLAGLAKHLAAEQTEVANEVELTRKNIEHIKDIVAMQQSYARVSGVVETVAVTDLVEDALRMNAGALTRHDVQVIRDYPAAPLEITVERQKVLQILVNLIRNAKYACDEAGRPDKRLTVQVRGDARGVLIAVADNGVGIPAENMTRIFNHGFTTRAHGHGFGLHSCALAAKDLGGTLTAHSDGPGAGARFALELPLQPPAQP